MELNKTSLDTVCAALCEIIGIDPPKKAAPANEAMVRYAGETLGSKADRVLMYNPDAIAQWIAEKYAWFIQEVTERTELQVPLRSVMPSVTPVNFATLYTGAQPEVHGIQKYEKPVLTVDTIFDALLRAGKKCIIISRSKDSIGKIFLERNMDYILCETEDEVNAHAAEVILRDEHDFIVIYNGNYDTRMHKAGPESPQALSELRKDSAAYVLFDELIRRNWKKHNVFMGFAMDHGCHEIDGDCGSHGLDMPEDLNICHFYKAYKAEI